MADDTFLDLVGANPAGTVIENLTTGSAPVKAALSETLNTALKAQLTKVFTEASLSALVSHLEQMPAADLVAAKDLTIQGFVKQHFEPLVGSDPTAQAAANEEIAKLSDTTTIGGLLQLDIALQAHPLFKADVLKADIAALLATSPPLTDPQLQAAFINRYSSSAYTIEKFWEELGTDPQFKVLVPELQLTLQLGRLCQNNSPLVAALRKEHQPKSLRDLTPLTADDWTKLINNENIPIPVSVEDTSAEKIANYVGEILEALRSAYPTDYIAQGIRQKPRDAVDQKISEFLKNAPEFNLITTHLQQYLGKNPKALLATSAEEKAAVVRRVQNYQRLARVNSEFAVINALMEKGLDSAYQISTRQRAAFLNEYMGVLGSPSKAAAVYDKAQHITAAATNFYMTVREGLSTVQPWVFGDVSKQVAAVVQQIPDWQELFGSTSYCECEDCRSVLGGAAYFTDLLHYLSSRHADPTNSGSPTLLDVLKRRRPDLVNIKLDCENTDTSLPYLDLVNEILESVVVSNAGQPPALPAYYTPADATPDQLSVNPEYTNDAAYAPLETAFYPFSLPFDRFLNTARSYLEFAGSSLYEVMSTFQIGADRTRQTSPFRDQYPSDQTISLEYLKVSSNEFAILTGQSFQGTSPLTNSNDLARYYGYNPDLSPAVATIAPSPNGAIRSSLVVTITTSAAHGYAAGQVVIISGVADTSFNGRFSIASVPSATTFTYIQDASDAGSGGGTASTALWYIDITSVPKFLRQTGITLDELMSLLETHFLNPAQAITLQVDPQQPCNLELITLANLAPGLSGGGVDLTALRRIYRFIRLYQKLGWKASDLDKAITALASTDIDGSFLLALSQIKQLQDKLNLTPVQALGLWAEIDTDGKESLYASLFQNKGGATALDPAFALQYNATLPQPHATAIPDLSPYAATISFVENATSTELSFTGTNHQPMTLNQERFLLSLSPDAGYRGAVQQLYQSGGSPASVAITGLPQGLILPSRLPDAIYHQGNQLFVIGAMPEDLRAQLKGLSPDSGYQLAIDDLYNMRWAPGTDVALASQPIAPHANTIRAALRLSAADLAAALAALSDQSALPQLTLANLSALYRYATLAQSLSISVRDLISLVQLTGINAFPWTADLIAVTVPSEAATGNVVVTVDGMVSNAVPFTIGTTPVIFSLSPAAGPVGTSVAITGVNFGAGVGGVSGIAFNETSATAASWIDTEIVVTVPSGATTGDVVVTAFSKPSNGIPFTVGATPVIHTLSPNVGPIGTPVTITGANFGTVPLISSLSPTGGAAGTSVTITGTNFGTAQGTSSVTFNLTPGAVTSWSNTQIVVSVPSLTGPPPPAPSLSSGGPPPVVVNVIVTVGGIASNSVPFSVSVGPGMLSSVPGPTNLPQRIADAGSAAAPATRVVTFNGTPATPTSWTNTEIVAIVPNGAATGNVLVTIGGTASNGVPFTVTTAPLIYSASPSGGPVGTSVTIAGANFGAAQGGGTVAFNGTPATPIQWTSTEIVVIVPNGAATGNIVVTVGGVASSGMAFTVGTLPVINSLVPVRGSVGASVMIRGANFGAAQGNSTITFNGTSARLDTRGTISFVKAVQAVLQSKFSVGALNYIYQNIADTTRGFGTQQSDLDQLISSLLSSLTSPPMKTNIATDPDGSLLRRYLTLVLDDPDVSQMMSLIDGSATYSAELAALPVIAFPPSLDGLIAYDTPNKRLSFKGPMSTLQEPELLALSTDADYQAAIQSLFHQSIAAWKTTYTSSPPSPSSIPPVVFPAALSGRIAFDATYKLITLIGPMSADQEVQLLALSTDLNYQAAIKSLFQQSKAAWAVTYTAALGALPAVTFPALLANRLIFTGPMSQTDENQLLALSGNDEYQAAIKSLFQQSAPAWTVVYTSSKSPNPLPTITFPAGFSGLITIDPTQTIITFNGPMSKEQETELLALSTDAIYQAAIENLFQQTAPAWNAVYSAPLDALPGITFPSSFGDRIVFVESNRRLSFAGSLLQMTGVMSDSDEVLLLDLSTNPGYQAAVGSIYAQPRQFIYNKLFFLDPETLIATLFDDPSATLPDKYGYVLNALVNVINAAVQILAGNLNLTIPLTRLLLVGGQTSGSPALLSSTIDPGLKAIADFLAVLGNGLSASYFPNPNFGGPALPVRIIPAIDFTWGPGTLPAPGLDPAAFSARWTGKVIAEFSETYTFYVRVTPSSGDPSFTNLPVALSVGGMTLPLARSQSNGSSAAANGVGPSAIEYMATCDLAAGEPTEIELDYPNNTGGALAGLQLGWSSLSKPKNVITQNHLYASSSFTLDGPLATYMLLGRIALLLNTFRITVEDLSYFASDAMGFSGVDPGDLSETIPFDLNRLPADQSGYSPALFNQWERLLAFFTLRDSLRGGDLGLLNILKAALSADPSRNIDAIIPLIAAATGWDGSEIAILAGFQNDPLTTDRIGFGLGTPDFTDERWLACFQACYGLMARFGVSSRQLFEWASLGSNPPAEPDIARDIQATIKAKYDDATWVKVGKPLNDKLRESSRDALVAYILTNASTWQLTLGGTPVTTRDELYEYFLIDVEMGACMLTSRIVQATAAVQLFVQRCLLNLEGQLDANGHQIGASPSAIDLTVWQWMKNYRVWQANREVFLYPENYIDSTLRDDKTPFFKELEIELQQNPITADAVERAVLNYLQKLDSVARLEISGIYWQLDRNSTGSPDGTPDATNDVLHVFARTFSTPHLYYYRRLLRASEYASAPSVSMWTPWEPISLDIEGDHLIPVIWNRRLFLFWPVFQETSDPTPPAGASGGKITQIKLAWSEYKQQHWMPKQLSSDFIVPRYLPANDVPSREYKGSVDTRWFTFNFTQGGNGDLFITAWIATWDPANLNHFITYDPDELPPIAEPSGMSWVGQFHLWDRAGDVLEDSVSLPLTESPIVTPANSLFQYMRISEFSPPNPPASNNPLAGTLSLARHQASASNFIQVLDKTPTPYRLAIDYGAAASAPITTPYAAPCFYVPANINTSFLQPFFFQDDERAYFVFITQQPPLQLGIIGITFATFSHQQIDTFIQSLNQYGISALLSQQTQTTTNPKTFTDIYNPVLTIVVTPFPLEKVDYTNTGAYSIYNWELFFHIPFLVATKLSQNQQFEEAQKWFHYIFNPITNSSAPIPQRFWNFLPFYECSASDEVSGSIENLLLQLDGAPPEIQPPECGQGINSQVAAWEGDPFNPFAIARMRTIAFRKTVVMKYLDNLIAWGDYLFNQNTRESINEATQIYVLAQQIVGARPVTIPQDGATQLYSYVGLPNLDQFSNVLVQLESAFPFSTGTGAANSSGTTPLTTGVPGKSFYFCIPPNSQLLGYWDTVADRLFKIRHCMNVQGVVEQLPLFAPPISPALLVRAKAMGIDLSSVLNDINSPAPNYRFPIVLAKALELCSEVRSLGAALLSALEKNDAEGLSVLRATQEANLLQAVLQIKQSQINEANNNLAALQASQVVTQYRQQYYQGLINTGWSSSESQQITQLSIAHAHEDTAQSYDIVGSSVAVIGEWSTSDTGVSYSFGGNELYHAASAVSQWQRTLALNNSYNANMLGITGGWDRRSQEWRFQLQNATLELAQIQKQIDTASVRLQIAQYDLRNQQLQIDNAQGVLNLLNSKYTNQELYGWMISQISAIYFQCYQMVYGLAKRAESCFRFELGLTNSNSIQFGYWDSLRKGLLAGDGLYADLKRMELAYIDQNKRDYEITKYISLLLLDPIALITLKETGQCIISLPEAFFDMDYPGQFMRRIKSVSLTIPCVTGPYTSVNCTLTLVSSKIRVENVASSPRDYTQESHFVTNLAATQSIATSSAQNDSGMFELNFRDDRYLPFEGAGVISTWQIQLPQHCNAFDFETISDVVINLRYTARDGGSALAAVAKQAAILPPPATQLPANGSGAALPAQTNLARFFSLKHEFPTEWYKFLNPLSADTAQTMNLALTRERFPYQYRGKKISLSEFDVMLKFKDIQDPQRFTTGTPLGDFAAGQGSPGSLNVYFTPTPSAPSQQPPQPPQPPQNPPSLILTSTAANFSGAPYGTTGSIPPAPLGPWWLQIFTTNNLIGSVPPTLLDTNGHLLPDLIDDMFLVCRYSTG